MDVYPVRVRWTYDGRDLAPTWDEIIRDFVRLPRLYPIGGSRLRIHDDIYGTMRIDYRLWTDDGQMDILEDLADHVGTCYVAGLAACGWHHGDIFMAMLHEDADLGDGSGRAYLDSPTAFSKVSHSFTPPHEIGHALAGLVHASNDHDEADGGSWEEWPYPHGGSGTTGFDAVRQRAKPVGDLADHSNDLMSYGDQKWISPKTYLRLYDSIGPNSSSVAQDGSEHVMAAGDYWLVSGRVGPYVEVRPIYEVWAAPASATVTATGRYTLELQDASGMAVSAKSFDPRPPAQATGEAALTAALALTDTRTFREYLPKAPGGVTIALKDGTTAIFTRTLSSSAPAITVTKPTAGSNWPATGLVDVEWSASDSDGDDLIYVLLYSPDSGASWVTVGTGVNETTYRLDAAELQGTSGQQALIRVLANDGMRTTAAESGPFSVARKHPQVHVIEPLAGEIIRPGLPLLLLASASDREDGLLPIGSVTWTDSISGVLGNGATLLARDLMRGPHVVTVAAADSDGNTSWSSTSFWVGYGPYLPIVSR